MKSQKNGRSGASARSQNNNRTSEKNNSPKKSASGSSPQKEVEFRLVAPTAALVQLAGDFTDWEQSSIPMVQLNDGTWFTSLTLAPGVHSYRFIVDGEWIDDPLSAQRAQNPFGSHNCIVQVM